ncbi:hypothetical protein BHECKSOX_191 [Bathymodiolus heckerae thiotrophic gill symbiont]|uniref:hypothetical protein n=1 Tax=Bathymodiolus heckerae thiotrophic gill symbiont TaxID=1052212 RepID=UPI0010BB2C25|nr:hypothetical protein [Bathymodiolus heckerae thiotrophic gill symbiont]SHN93401.1 hypothetical protein BHECKSOX_191 [Bathymodiolus heckerae thiotrophic gill symbiont]
MSAEEVSQESRLQSENSEEKRQPGQPDNVLIDECDKWVKKGRVPAEVMSGFVESPSNLWQKTGVPSHIVPATKEDKKYIS